MAKSVKTATIQRADEIEDAEHFEIVTDSNGERPRMTDADEALLDFWEQSVTAGADAYIVIMRLIEGQGATRQQMCERVPVDKYDYYSLQMYIRDNYGGGDYRLLLFGPDPRRGGKKGQLQNQLISIAKKQSTELALVPGQQADTGNGGAVGVLLREVLQELRAIHNTPQKSLAEQVQEMATIATAMKTAFGGGEPKKSAMENAMEKMMEQMMLKNFENMLSGDAGGEKESSGIGDRLLNILEGAAPLVMTAMANRQARPVRPAPRPHVNPAPRPVNARTVRPNPAEAPKQPKEEPAVTVINPAELTDEQKTIVKGYIEKGVMAAAMGADPERIAAAAVEQDPDAVEQLLAVPDLLNEAIKLVPSAEKHRQWFDDLIEWCKGHMGIPGRFEDQFEDGEDEAEEVEPEEQAPSSLDD